MNTGISMFVREEEGKPLPAVPTAENTELTLPSLIVTTNQLIPDTLPAPVIPAAPTMTPPDSTTAEDKAHERPHHPTSPSQLQNLEACPCYAGRGGTSEAAERGTKQHAASETGHDDGSMKDEEAMAVATCIDFFEREKQLLLEARQRAIDGGLPDPGVVYELREVYLPIDNRRISNFSVDTRNGTILPVPTDCTTGGFIDAVLVAGKFALAMDWKFGQWPVEEAKNNLQAIAYALGLFRMFPELEAIRFVFLQPHIDYSTEHTFKRTDVPALYLRVCTIVERTVACRASNSFEHAKPQVPVCNFCGRIGRCTKVAELVLKVADKFFPGEIPENITPSALHTEADTATCLRLGQIVTTWADAFKRITTDRVIRGVAPMPAGYKLQERADREVVDKAKFKTVVQQFITREELEGIAEYGLGKIEDIISDKAPRGTKTAKLDEFKSTLFSTGAMKKGQPYSFLKAVATKKEKQSD